MFQIVIQVSAVLHIVQNFLGLYPSRIRNDIAHVACTRQQDLSAHNICLPSANKWWKDG